MTLFREWSKYRYGVFPESGFQDGDRLYPHLYSEGNETKTNRGCIDDTMTPYCPLDGSYNRRAPTKQNLLCKERSALETILSHPDFKREDENATEMYTGYVAPKFASAQGPEKQEFSAVSAMSDDANKSAAAKIPAVTMARMVSGYLRLY